MNRVAYISLIFIVSCQTKFDKKESHIESLPVDSVIVKSRSLHDSSDVVLKVTDMQTQEKVKDMVNQVRGLQTTNKALTNENQSLKQSLQVTKTITIRDTIYITEKKNFWGKTKRSVDSGQSVVEDKTLIDTLKN